MSLYQACEMMHKIFIRSGYPGIYGVGDAGNEWAISPAQGNSNEVDFGCTPYFVNKESGKIRVFSRVDENDWRLIESAQPLEVPEPFRVH